MDVRTDEDVYLLDEIEGGEIRLVDLTNLMWKLLHKCSKVQRDKREGLCNIGC